MKNSPFRFLIILPLIVCLGLGTWQIFRKAEKEELLKSLELAQQEAPVDVDTLNTPRPFQPLFAEGHFVPGKTVFLKAKTHEGKNGVYVLNVFQTRGGKFLLIQRGWALQEIQRIPEGTIRLEGVLRTPSVPNYFQPPNDPPTYFWIDLNLLSQTLHKTLLPYYLVATSSFDTKITPVKPMPFLKNNHLYYVITWYFLAFVLGVMLLLGQKDFYLKKDER